MNFRVRIKPINALTDGQFTDLYGKDCVDKHDNIVFDIVAPSTFDAAVYAFAKLNRHDIKVDTFSVETI